MPSQRLDAALSARGLVRSRSLAARLIAAGRVTVDGRPALKPSAPVAEEAVLAVSDPDHYVGRGAHKLLAALDAFGLDPTGRLALDAGASTGGFTQVLLERGACRVLAVDVGHGQLAAPVLGDPRVVNLEGVNVRDLTPERLAALAGDEERPSLVVADLSFISLTQVLPALAACAAPEADLVLLVKPQFEVGRTGIREGIVTEPALRQDAIERVLWAAWDLGLGTAGVIPSPIVGTHGNRECLVRVGAAAGTSPAEWRRQVEDATGG